MSLSKPRPENPAKKFIEFKGDSGKFQYYDKSLEKNIEIDYPIRFIVLDELSTITGYNDETQSGVYSNEVHNTSKEELFVRTFKGNRGIKGKYKDIKSDIVSLGGKFCKSIYAILFDADNNGEIVNFKMKGAAFSAWMDKPFNPEYIGVQITGTHEGKKGAIKYQIPDIEQLEFTGDIMKRAAATDRKLQAFLEERKSWSVEAAETVEEPQGEPQEGYSEPDDSDEVPF